MKGKAWRWVFLLSGICGSLLLLRSAEGLLWNHWRGYLWMLHNLKKTSGSLWLHALGWMSLIIPAAFFLAAVLLTRWNTDWFYQAVYQAEGIVRRNLKRKSGTSDHFSDGVLNRGNIYPAGIEQFRVRVSQEPSEDMYLKDFTGGTYSNGKWEPADDAVLFERMNRNTLHWEQWEGWIANLYESLYFAMNRSAGNLPREEGRELFIEYNGNSAGNWYEPYYSRWDKHFWNSDHYAKYRLEYFEQGEIEINWDDVNRYFETARDWYREVQDAYMKEAEVIYTEVPQEELPGLSRLCDSHPMENRERAAGRSFGKSGFWPPILGSLRRAGRPRGRKGHAIRDRTGRTGYTVFQGCCQGICPMYDRASDLSGNGAGCLELPGQMGLDEKGR